ncbi:hypothetical protein T265_00560 [Opisthorchis viverrini]|uniref:Prefoldin subunit n=1 Tax=Opisthorchis viverrini TaxID=6198 RepID=A0A075A1V9_OPIVI|nr:hypothetical protein T265_00560 [Opisthorchis viverrini]KER33678.1 hypothetical protein T265_00560 [Opisthorchis viverrini]
MSADPEVKRAIEAHRQQTIVANQQINILNAQLEALTMKHRRSELVEQELKALPTETVVYKALGRMFLRKSVNTITEDILKERLIIDNNMETLKVKICSLQKNKEAVSSNLSESKEALRELLSSKQQA